MLAAAALGGVGAWAFVIYLIVSEAAIAALAWRAFVGARAPGAVGSVATSHAPDFNSRDFTR